jgi:hypothetical protein
MGSQHLTLPINPDSVVHLYKKHRITPIVDCWWDEGPGIDPATCGLGVIIRDKHPEAKPEGPEDAVKYLGLDESFVDGFTSGFDTEEVYWRMTEICDRHYIKLNYVTEYYLGELNGIYVRKALKESGLEVVS